MGGVVETVLSCEHSSRRSCPRRRAFSSYVKMLDPRLRGDQGSLLPAHPQIQFSKQLTSLTQRACLGIASGKRHCLYSLPHQVRRFLRVTALDAFTSAPDTRPDK